MTKKSTGRKQRDRAAAATLQNRVATGIATANTVTRMSPAERLKARSQFNRRVNTCWDDTNQSKEITRRALGTVAGMVQEIIGDKSILPYLENQSEYLSRVKSVTDDINQLVADYELGAQTHAGKAGGSNDPDDVIMALQANELYHQITTKINSVVFPMLSTIAASAGVARTRQAYVIKAELEAKQKEGELTETESAQLGELSEITQGLEELSAEMTNDRVAQANSADVAAADDVGREDKTVEEVVPETEPTETEQPA